MKTSDGLGGKREFDVARDCPICGRAYVTKTWLLASGRGTSCSRPCSYTLRGREKTTSVLITCAVCGTEVSREPTHVKGKHGAQFCSRSCHYAGRRLGLSRRVVTKSYSYSEGGLTRLSKAAARLYASGTGLSWPESELAVARRLTELGIRFVHQHVIEMTDRSYVVDFFFADRNLVIELDGYARHLRDRKVVHSDRERDRRLRALGLRVVRLRDDKVPEHAVKAVLGALLEGAEGRPT